MNQTHELPVEIRLRPSHVVLGGKAWDIGYQTPGAAGIDLRADIVGVMFMPADNATVKIGTGIAVHIKHPGYMGLVVPRSGLGAAGLTLANTVGIIDSDYQGEIILAVKRGPLTNGENVCISPGDRIAQLIFMPIARAVFSVVDEFSEKSQRGDKGFGSTGR